MATVQAGAVIAPVKPAGNRPGGEIFSTRFADYECRLNALAPEELFARYERGRFLYPAKRERLEPIRSQILDTWQRLGRAGALLAWVIDRQDERTGGWASVMSWRSTYGGWVSQHLVSTGGPALSRAVLLAGCAFRISLGSDTSHQNWFRQENAFAAAVFGTFADRVGPDRAVNVTHALMDLPVHQPVLGHQRATVVRIGQGDGSTGGDGTGGDGSGGDTVGITAVREFVRRVRGAVYVRAEQLDGVDPELRGVDDLYGLVGLRRHRTIHAVRDGDRVLAVALCYRGPIGINLSLLENRCDLVLDPTLAPHVAETAIRGLLTAARGEYQDLPGGRIPVVVHPALTDAVARCGATPVRRYTQCVWSRDAFVDWGAHVAGIYARRLAHQPRA